MSLKVRPATKQDLPQVRDIYEYYVLNTVISFLSQAPPLDYVTSRYEESIARRLPYLVAVDDSSEEESVLAYAYASPYRGFMLSYGHTVEITIFVRHGHTDKGVGTKLMKALLYALRKTKHVSREAGYENNPQEYDIRHVLAIMSVDDETPKKGLELRNWYLHWGFQQVGRLKNVGFKNGRSLDTIFLELSLV